jgi:GntR family transcriptional regulator
MLLMSALMPLPKYHQVYLVLREQVCDGQFAAGLPSELALQQQFGVARITVRRALEQLAAEGLIAREPGRGTRPMHAAVSASHTEAAHNPPRKAKLTGLLENLVTMGLATSVKVLDVQHIAATQEVAQALRIGVGDGVQKAIRVRSTKAGPFSHITTYIPEAICAQFGRKELAKKPILLLLEEAGVQVGRAEQTISARLADAQLAQHLDIAVGSALLAVRRLIFDEQERPVQWLHGFYRPDRYEYALQLSRVGDIDAKVWVSKELSAHFH